jgi:hypothetical protein
MPPVFKALASITVWILFIVGCLMVLTIIPIPFLHYYGGGWQNIAVGIASLSLSVAVMKARKSLE